MRSVVQVYLGPPRNSGVPGSTDTRAADDHRMPRGGVAQLGERLVCNQEAIGSIPFTSTILRSKSEGHTVFELRMASHLSLFERRMPYEAPKRRLDGCREERSRAIRGGTVWIF